MKVNRFFVAAAAAVVPAAIASAYTLSINSVSLPQSASSQSATITLSIAPQAGDPLMNSFQGMLFINGPSGLQWSSAPVIPAGSPYATWQAPTQFNGAPGNQQRGALMFNKDNDSNGSFDDVPIVAGGLFSMNITIPANLAPGTYGIVISDPDTFASNTNFEENHASQLTNGAVTITAVPEPASALLLLGALPFLRRRSA